VLVTILLSGMTRASLADHNIISVLNATANQILTVPCNTELRTCDLDLSNYLTVKILSLAPGPDYEPGYEVIISAANINSTAQGGLSTGQLEILDFNLPQALWIIKDSILDVPTSISLNRALDVSIVNSTLVSKSLLINSTSLSFEDSKILLQGYNNSQETHKYFVDLIFSTNNYFTCDFNSPHVYNPYWIFREMIDRTLKLLDFSSIFLAEEILIRNTTINSNIMLSSNLLTITENSLLESIQSTFADENWEGYGTAKSFMSLSFSCGQNGGSHGGRGGIGSSVFTTQDLEKCWKTS
jgi:hypothetical protein